MVVYLIIYLIFILIAVLIKYKKHIWLIKNINPKEVSKESQTKYYQILLLTCLLTVTGFSLLQIYERDEIITQYTDKVEWFYVNTDRLPDNSIKHIYLEFNEYYAGFSPKISGYTIYVTRSSPQLMLDYITNHNLEYEYVEHSYNELASLGTLLFNQVIHDHETVTIYLDYSSNQLVLVVLNLDYDVTLYQYYIDNNILRVELGDYYDTHN